MVVAAGRFSKEVTNCAVRSTVHGLYSTSTCITSQHCFAISQVFDVLQLQYSTTIPVRQSSCFLESRGDGKIGKLLQVATPHHALWKDQKMHVCHR